MQQRVAMNDVKRQTNTLVVAITAIVAVLAKRASRLPRKLKAAVTEPAVRESPKLPLRRPKKLLTKTLSFLHKKKKNKKKEGEEWGDGGVWQKEIMMGDKCEPLDFSGVIYYDSNGNQVNEIPFKSPRARGEGWGDGGVWQKEIMMGDKCEPLDFSGVIYYDSNGNQVNEIPFKSPRASHANGYFIRKRERKL